MKIVLVKAAEPDFRWEKQYTPADFARAVANWENTPVSVESIHPMKAEGYRVLAAASLHAGQTARAWLRDGAGAEFPYETTELLNEIPLAPFSDEGRAFSYKKFIRCGKRQWKHGDARQPEGREESEKLAARLVEQLEQDGRDVILIGHERRILFLLKILRKRGYQIRRGSLFRLEPMERILAAKQIPACGGCGHNCQLSHPGCSVGAEKARKVGL